MSKKKFELNEEDKELFRNAMKDVKPINEDNHIPPPRHKKPKIYKENLSVSPRNFRFSAEIILEKLSDNEWLTPENSIHFTQSEIPLRTRKQLRNGKIPVDEKLDLHGYTGDEAINALSQCLSRAQANGVRIVLIIHGKSQVAGQHGPILKNIVYQWLKNRPEVLAIQSAQPKDGGNGAVYVLIRRQKF